jgi:hypothetical protein
MIADTSTHKNLCTSCHVNTDTDGRLVDGTGGSSPYTTTSVGDATVHTWGSTSSCARCHANHNTSFTTGHGYEDHANLVTSTNCDGCHADAMITGADTHNNQCTYCHVSTDTDGSLVSGATGTATDDVGDATIHAWGSTSSCVDCHDDGGTNYAYGTDFDNLTTGHRVQDHDGLTGMTSATLIYDCNNCHSAATKSAIASATHPSCDNCHSDIAINGELVDGTNGSSSGDVGDATGHTIGALSSCGDCHGATGGYNYDTNFENHIYANSTDTHIAPPGSGTSVFQLAGTDEITGTTCDTCHGSTLTDWANVYSLHNVSTNGPGACATCHNSTRPGDTDADGIQNVIHANNQSTNPCISCHQSKASDHSDHRLTTWVMGNAECTGCHDQTAQDNQTQMIEVIHSNNCGLCHNNPGGGDYTLIGSAAGNRVPEDNPGGNTCNTCHDGDSALDYANFFGSAHQTVDHQTELAADVIGSTATCTNNCHTGDTITLVHTDDCLACHVNTLTDGRLKDNAGAGNGTADSHTIDSVSTCADCHEDASNYTYQSAYAGANGHKVQDHDGLTGTTNSTDPVYNCNSCHAAATKTEIAETTHGVCTNCHTGNGDLVGAGAQGFGTTVGHSIGSTSSCLDCHENGSTYNYGTDFETHTYANATYHQSGGSNNTHTTVKENATLDHSQETTAPCSKCHFDLAGSAYADFTHWDEIAYEHDYVDGTQNGVGSCVICHNSTRDVCADSGKCTQAGTTVNDVILTGANPTDCAACHVAKITTLSSNAAHGGHGDADFQWLDQVGSIQSCGSASCHNAAVNTNVVNDVHIGRSATAQGSNCENCHTSASGGDGTAKNGDAGFGVDGDARLGSTATPHNDICTVCHAGSIGDIHHDVTDATSGNCQNCHIANVGETTTPQTRANGQLDMPTNLACNF